MLCGLLVSHSCFKLRSTHLLKVLCPTGRGSLISVLDWQQTFQFFHLHRCSCLNPLSTKLYLSDLKTHFVPRSKHSASVLKTSQLMLYREIIAVCSEIHTKHINTLCGQNVELLNVKLAVHIVTTGL